MTGQVFVLPDLGEGLLEAELVRWHVKVGDPIAIDEPVAEVETAKATVEIPSPYGGVVAHLHADEGGVVQVGEPLISVTAGSAPDVPGNVLVGYGPAAAPTNGARRHRKVAEPTTARADRPARASSPVVRMLAKGYALDLATIAGSGPDGLITRGDVERAAASRPSTDVTPTDTNVTPTDVDKRTGLPIAARVRLQGTRRAIARALTRSRREIPEATIWADVDATELLELRTTLDTTGEGPGVLALVARIVVAGLVRFPALNARVDDDAEQIVQLDGVNLGIATQTDRGLVVPSVVGAHTMTARALGTEIRRLTSAARAGSTTPAELTRGSFTLNNYGRFGVDGSAAIINHPEVAILGLGRIIPRPWVVGGAIVPREITQLSLVFDHRVCDGGTAAGFLRFVADAIESPASLVAEL